YSFRSNFATTVKKSAGLDAATKAMGHQAGSNIVSEHYDVGNSRMDFFGIAAGEEIIENIVEDFTPAIYRAQVQVVPLGIAGLVEHQPMIAILLKQAQNLKSYLALGGSNNWQPLIVRTCFLLLYV
ncbi:hypothetical protein C8R45DRAFT_785781, partial [Mycena sanguinolenta]